MLNDEKQMPAEFYLPQDPAESNSLVWFDEESSTLFSISGFMNKETMVRMAKCIEAASLTDWPKNANIYCDL